MARITLRQNILGCNLFVESTFQIGENTPETSLTALRHPPLPRVHPLQECLSDLEGAAQGRDRPCHEGHHRGCGPASNQERGGNQRRQPHQ